MSIVDEQRNAALIGAEKDRTSAPCEVCHTSNGTTWVGRQWVCDMCRKLVLTDVDLEILPPEMRARNELRRRGFGGSDAGVLAGVDPYRDTCSLVLEKQGELEPMPPGIRALMGKFVEQGLLRGYSWMTGREVRYSDELHFHPSIAFMLATPDALVVGEDRGVDAKLSAPDQNWQWLAGPPAHYIAQAQWYMRFFGYPVWDICRWNGSELKIYTVDEDRVMQDGLLRIAEILWYRYVLTGEIPMIGTSAGSERYLKEHFPRNRGQLRRATEEEAALLVRYADVRRTHEEISDTRQQIENRLKLIVGHDDGIWSDTAKFTYKASRDVIEVNWEQIAQKFLDQLPQDDRKKLITEHSTTKAGSRRIHFSPKGLQHG